MQQTIVWHHEKIYTACSLEQLHSALQDQDSTTWLDLQIDDNLAKYTDLLRNEFKLSPLTIETIQEEKERARLVDYHDYFYLIMHGLSFDTTMVEADTPKLDIVFGKNFLITLHREAMPWLTELLQTVHTHRSEENIMSRGMAHLLHTILDTLVDTYFPVLDDIDTLVDELEHDTVEKANNEVQARLFRMKRAVAKMRRVVSPQIEVSHALITRTGDFIPTEIEPYFADVHDHLVRTFEAFDGYRDLLSGLLDVYLSTISNRMNEVMKQLAIISTIFLPITFITGVFGQNFGHTPQVEHDNGLNFWFVLIFMAVVTLAQLVYFRYRKWL